MSKASNSEEYIRKYMIEYFQNKDLFFKRIKSIDESESASDGGKKSDKTLGNIGFTINYKDGRSVDFIIVLELDEKLIDSKIKSSTNLSVVALNNKDNLDIITKSWKSIESNPSLTFYFVNPFSAQDKRWVLYPHSHSKITDNFKDGLKTLLHSVDSITVKQIEKQIKADS